MQIVSTVEEVRKQVKKWREEAIHYANRKKSG